jgi:glycosyltransferase involved in cell wall biosynthesis
MSNKKILLISNKVMHYRVSVYNYFSQQFRKYGWEFVVRSNEIQEENPHPVEFDIKEIEFKFRKYKKEIETLNPDIVILFLHLKDLIIWPLIHWLKLNNYPVVNWTKGANLDNPGNRIKHHMFNYVFSKCDRLILYSKYEIDHIKDGFKDKVFIANNTINHEAYPVINDSKEQIKSELGIPFKKIVLSVGRMDVNKQRKKINHLIDIFNAIDSNEYGLLIVGAMDEESKKRINNNNIRYLGEIHDPENVTISKIFKMADVFSIPGHVGLGLVQAFYWGLPVVTEEGLQPPEIHYLKDGRNGFIVPNNDIEKLKERILYLLRNDNIRKEYSANARKDILENASIEGMFWGFKNCVDSIPLQ